MVGRLVEQTRKHGRIWQKGTWQPRRRWWAEGRGPRKWGEQRTVFEKTSGLEFSEADWRIRITRASALVLALSIEQSLLTLAIRTTAAAGCLRERDLYLLWCDIPEEECQITAPVGCN